MTIETIEQKRNFPRVTVCDRGKCSKCTRVSPFSNSAVGSVAFQATRAHVAASLAKPRAAHGQMNS